MSPRSSSYSSSGSHHPTGSHPSHGGSGSNGQHGSSGGAGGRRRLGFSASALDRMAGKLDRTSEKLRGVARRIGHIDVGPQSFGVIGQAFAGGTRQHLQATQDVTDRAAGGVAHAATGTRQTRQSYQDTEAHNTSTFQGVDANGRPAPRPHDPGSTAPSSTTPDPTPVQAPPTTRGNGSGDTTGGHGPTTTASPSVAPPPTVGTSSSAAGGSGTHTSGAGGGDDRPPRPPDQSNTGHYTPGGGKRKRPDSDEADDQPSGSQKGEGKADPDPAPPPRRSRRTLGQEPEVAFDDRAGEPPRPGGGGWALGDGYNHHADLTGPNGPVRVGGRGADHPTNNEDVDYGRINVHHQGVEPQQFHPEPPPAGAKPPTKVQPHDGEPTSSYVSKDVMEQFAGRRDEFPGQNTVMGGSATQAMQSSGMHVDPNTSRDWMHGHGFSSGGENHRNPNEMENLTTAGEHGANIRHLQWENAVRNQGTDMLGVVPTTVTPGNPINPNLHVYGHLDYTYHSPDDPNLSHTIPIDTTNPQMPRNADGHYAGRQMETDAAYMIMHQMQGQGENLHDYDPNLPSMMGNWQQQNMPPGAPVHPPESSYHPAGSHLPADPSATPPGSPAPSQGSADGPGVATQMGNLDLDDGSDRMSVDDD